ncbi:exo-beta-N-acetylmuramidase NamZ domain-containing protein [Terriglobus roseus]|uniref:exo-beta-N-acetylmuramidase NamZ domain-containing protein n=1 Tax=Terriglobus roseus TaxID=392734 RepID=UPI0009F53309|nr:exo-beta-N-acetylmuramidase NamZ domain-containing protein [Terriglobus roseus]
MHATELAAYLQARKIPGVSFMPVTYVPNGSEHYPYIGKRVEGVEIIVNDRNALDAQELGMEAVSALWKLYPQQFQLDRVDRLLLNKSALEEIRKGTDPRAISAGWQSELDCVRGNSRSLSSLLILAPHGSRWRDHS